MESKLKGTLAVKDTLVSVNVPVQFQPVHGYKPDGTSWHTTEVAEEKEVAPNVYRVKTQNSVYLVKHVSLLELAFFSLRNQCSVRLYEYGKSGIVTQIKAVKCTKNTVEITQVGDDSHEWVIYDWLPQ